MKILFLDIDGVLCTTRASFDRFPCLLQRLDPIGIDFLNAFCSATDCKIVMSSTWRLDADESFKSRVFQPLLTAGLKQKHIFYDDPITKEFAGIRGNEIQEWLDRHKEVDNYIILDDDSDMLETHKEHFVQTSIYNGILFENMRQCCEIFNVDPKDLNR